MSVIVLSIRRPSGLGRPGKGIYCVELHPAAEPGTKSLRPVDRGADLRPLPRYRRLAIRWARRIDIHYGFLNLDAALI